MHDNPKGAGDADASPTAAQDIRDQGIVLIHILYRHPTLLTIPDLVREITSGSEDFGEGDAIERAVRDLTGVVERPLSNRTINKTLTRLGQILDAAVRYELIEHNPVKTKVEKLKEAEPRRVRLTGEQVQVLLQAAGEHRTLIATAIMAGGLRVSELTHLRWRDLDLCEGTLNVAASKTAAGVRQVVLDPELVQLLREHRLAAEWSQPDDFVFAGRIREKPRERNSVRTRILYGAIEKANKLLAAEDRPPVPGGHHLSTRCAERTRHCEQSWASIRRSPLHRWDIAIRV